MGYVCNSPPLKSMEIKVLFVWIMSVPLPNQMQMGKIESYYNVAPKLPCLKNSLKGYKEIYLQQSLPK